MTSVITRGKRYNIHPVSLLLQIFNQDLVVKIAAGKRIQTAVYDKAQVH
jgi:hypothetical protein